MRTCLRKSCSPFRLAALLRQLVFISVRYSCVPWQTQTSRDQALRDALNKKRCENSTRSRRRRSSHLRRIWVWCPTLCIQHLGSSVHLISVRPAVWGTWERTVTWPVGASDVISRIRIPSQVTKADSIIARMAVLYFLTVEIRGPFLFILAKARLDHLQRRS